jgi:hypothetical protein
MASTLQAELRTTDSDVEMKRMRESEDDSEVTISSTWQKLEGSTR